MPTSGSILVTGSTGYLGSLIVACLLVEESARIVVPVRRPISFDDWFQVIAIELQLAGHRVDPAFRDRIRLISWPPVDRLRELDAVADELEVDRVIHAAGCLDYFDREALRAVNVDLTAALLDRARAWGCRKFAYLSTAFSSGYLDGVTREAVHRSDSFNDPTEYTRAKRDAELLVADAGVPYLIIRPSIVVGDSRDGHYSGKRYGLYQLWNGMERLLLDAWQPEFHAVGPRIATHFLHQDAFQQMFVAAWRHSPDDTVFNAVSEQGPTLRDLWAVWLGEVLRPGRVHYYPTVASMPVRKMDRRQRSLLALASVNLEIAAHPWQFEMTHLARLEQAGLVYPRTTVESIATCQRAFVAESEPIQTYLTRFQRSFAERIEVVEFSRPDALHSLESPP
jgi:nucleoside-diphosphate-sugar epimerase